MGKKLVISKNNMQYVEYMQSIGCVDRTRCIYLSSENVLRGIRNIEVIRTSKWWLNPYCQSYCLSEIEGRNNGNVFHVGESVNIRGKSGGKTLEEYVKRGKTLEGAVISRFEQGAILTSNIKYIIINNDYFLPIDLEYVNNFGNEVKRMFDEIINDL